MDLLSSIRKEGSRGGVNFQWSDVANSSHRENYLGHSLMAPVGRWQKGKDLNWYAKADDKEGIAGETDAEKQERLRMEEIKLIKEAEEDALATALGLPVKDRTTTGANAMPIAPRESADAAANMVEQPHRAIGEDVTRIGFDAPERRPARKEDADDRGRHRSNRHKHHHRSRRERSRSRSGDRHNHRDRRSHREAANRSRSRSPRRRSDRDAESDVRHRSYRDHGRSDRDRPRRRSGHDEERPRRYRD